MLNAWARVVVHRRGWVLLGGLVGVLLLAGLSVTAGGKFSDVFGVPGAESQRALDLLRERFPAEAGSDAQLVFRAEPDVRDPAVRASMEQLFAEIAAVPEVVGVRSPYAVPSQIARDGRTAFAVVQYADQARQVDEANILVLGTLADAVRAPGLRIELGGEAIRAVEMEGPGQSEIYGLLAAAVVLLIAFGSVIAMGLPLLTALGGLVAGFLIITLMARGLDISTIAPSFAAMLGLGVGIDYALFVVTRYREGLAMGQSVEDAVSTAVSTAGRAVIFAGIAVTIALLGLLVIGLPFIANLALATAVVVLTAVVVAVTILPALLAVIGPRIDRWSLPFLHAAGVPEPESFWFRLARMIQRWPALFLMAGLGLLGLLTIPVLDAELGASDDGNNPSSRSSRRAYDLLADGFGPGFNGPLLLVVEQAPALNPVLVGDVRRALERTPNVTAVSSPRFNAARDTAVLTVFPGTSPQDRDTRALVDTIRAEVLPAALGPGAPVHASVSGATAAFIDVAERISSRTVPFFSLVIGLSFLLLLIAFRSLAVALKAAAMNVVAIGAAFGVVVAVFQWGWGAELIGVERTGPVESFLPIFLFAILFGLSMDYEVFLMSRIRERYLEDRDNTAAVAHGLAVSGRVITAAAAIMVTVFASFAFGDSRIIKEFGLGLAVAILLDATIVRLLLVPAIMELLGQVNWWMPAWLDRLLPRISVEGAAPVLATVVAAPRPSPAAARSAAVPSRTPVLIGPVLPPPPPPPLRATPRRSWPVLTGVAIAAAALTAASTSFVFQILRRGRP